MSANEGMKKNISMTQMIKEKLAGDKKRKDLDIWEQILVKYANNDQAIIQMGTTLKTLMEEKDLPPQN